MTQYSQGTVLTCEHEECSCRVRIDEECHCLPEGQVYICACGAPMVEVADVDSAMADTATAATAEPVQSRRG
ncbi:MAG: hypothetical protein ACT4NY_31990 [Pseudonocardiales bacterium]